MLWRLRHWWLYQRPTLYRRCFDCGRLEWILYWRVGHHGDCLPF